MGIVTNHAHNEKEDTMYGIHLQGGTAVWAIGRTRGYISKQKQDTKGMGRWSRTDYEGRNGRRTAIYSVYIPNYATGEMTVCQQQIRALLEEGDTTEPRETLKRDLKSDIQDAKAEGKEIILGGDFNYTIQEGGLEGNKWKNWLNSVDW